MSCALGSSLALGLSICGLCGHPEGPHSQPQGQLAASCSVSSYFKQARAVGSSAVSPLSGLLSDIVFEFPGSESPAAHGHGHQPGCYNTRKHFPCLYKKAKETQS